jgi:DNA-binding NarL/FixJ family response regulator
MIAAGLSNKRIAVQLKRSVKTIEKHRANLMRKLHLHNVADVTRFALQSGLLREQQSASPD